MRNKTHDGSGESDCKCYADGFGWGGGETHSSSTGGGCGDGFANGGGVSNGYGFTPWDGVLCDLDLMESDGLNHPPNSVDLGELTISDGEGYEPLLTFAPGSYYRADMAIGVNDVLKTDIAFEITKDGEVVQCRTASPPKVNCK